MIKSTEKSGTLIESALKKVGMLAISRYGLSTIDLLAMLYRAELEVIRAHWEQDKDGYYETRVGIGTTNWKYCASGASYDAVTSQLSVTMTPAAASANDVGKMITFFDAASLSGVGGTITGFVAGSPNKYVVSTFFPIVTLASVVGVTVADTLLSDNILRLTDGNEIWTPEKLELYDAGNDQTIEVVANDEFYARRRLDTWKNGSTRWARYMKSSIDFEAGSEAPIMGALRISAYWLPPRTRSYDDTLYCSDIRLGEVEREMMTALLELKVGQPMLRLSATNEEKFQERIKSEQSREELSKTR